MVLTITIANRECKRMLKVEFKHFQQNKTALLNPR
jgi:hypothetical protein